jgi:two-component system nitrate/nitrite response regulator NarL
LRLAGCHSQGRVDPPPDQLLGALTRREVEIVGLIAEDLSNKQIASTLHVALSTVKNHIHNVMQKLHTSRRSEIAALARAAGLAPGRVGSRSLRI